MDSIINQQQIQLWRWQQQCARNIGGCRFTLYHTESNIRLFPLFLRLRGSKTKEDSAESFQERPHTFPRDSLSLHKLSLRNSLEKLAGCKPRVGFLKPEVWIHCSHCTPPYHQLSNSPPLVQCSAFQRSAVQCIMYLTLHSFSLKLCSTTIDLKTLCTVTLSYIGTLRFNSL